MRMNLAVGMTVAGCLMLVSAYGASPDSRAKTAAPQKTPAEPSLQIDPCGSAIAYALQRAIEAAKPAEKVVLTDRPFCEKCAVRSDVTPLLPKQSLASKWPLDKTLSEFNATWRSVLAGEDTRYVRRIGLEPVHEKLDALSAKANPTLPVEAGLPGEIMAGKLHLQSPRDAVFKDIEETSHLRSNISRISADLRLRHHIALLTRGWQRTFQLPLDWDDFTLQTRHRNESAPAEEPVKFPEYGGNVVYLIGLDLSQEFNR